MSTTRQHLLDNFSDSFTHDLFPVLQQELWGEFNFAATQLEAQSETSLNELFTAIFPDFAPKTAPVPSVEGLGLKLSIPSAEFPPELQWLLFESGLSQLEMKGQLEVWDELPAIYLTSEVSNTLDLLGNEFPLQVELVAIPDLATQQVVSFARILSVVDLNLNNKSLPVTLEAVFQKKMVGLLRLDAYFDGEAVLDIADLTALLQVPNGAAFFQAPFPSTSGLRLHQLGFTLDLPRKEIWDASIRVSSNAEWNVVPDLVTLKGFELALNVVTPRQDLSVRAALTSETLIGGVSMNTLIGLPELELHAQMKEGPAFYLGDLISSLLNQEIPMPKLQVEDFGFDTNINEKYFSCNMTVKDAWDFKIGSSSIQLETIRAYLTMHDGSPSVVLYTNWNIGEVQLTVQMSYFAGGWRFDVASAGSIHLATVVGKLTELFGFELPREFPEVDLKRLQLYFDSSGGDLSFEGELEAVQNIDLFASPASVRLTSFQLKHHSTGTVGQLAGSIQLMGLELSLVADLGEEMVLSGAIPEFQLSKIVSNVFTDQSITLDLFDLTFEDIAFRIIPAKKSFSFSGTSAQALSLPIGVDELALSDVAFDIFREKKGNKYHLAGFVQATLEIGAAALDFKYDFPGDFVLTADLPALKLSTVVQDLCGSDALIGFPAPASVIDVDFREVHFSIAPKQKSLSISGATDFGEAELQVKKSNSGKWGFVVGFAPPETIPFSSIDPALSGLEELKFSNAALIISTTQNASIQLSVIEGPPSGVTVSKGLNLFADLDLTGLGVDELANVQSLYIHAAIGNRPSNIVLEASMGGSIQLSDNVSFGDLKFRLQPTPSNFAIGIRGAVRAKLMEDELTFIGGMEIRPILRTAAFQAMMKGTWNEPFGFKGVAIADVAADIGLTLMPPPAPPLPVVGLAGSLQVGSVAGSAAVRFDSAMPTKSMVAVAFNELYLKDIIQTFCEPAVYRAIPRELSKTVLDVGMEDVEVYVVPQPTQIVDLYYDPGLTIKGSISIADFDAYAHINIDYTTGILVEAEMDSIDVAGLFKLSGSKDKAHPMLLLDLRKGHTPALEIAGSIDLLGLQAETRVSINDTSFYFWVSGKIFNLFEASIEASGAKFDQGGDFYLKATMKNDLFAYLREKATAAIQSAAEEATKDLTEAQEELSRKQAEVNRLDGEIDRVRGIIRNERERDERNVRNARKEVENLQREVGRLNGEIKKMRAVVKKERERDERNVRNARNEVNTAKKKVDGLQRDMDAMRRTINAERARDVSRISSAKRDVTAAQNSVNSLQSEINSSHSRIKTLKGHISSKKRWYDRKPWYDKTWAWAEYGAYAAAKGAEISGLYAKIGSVEAAKHTAKGALEIAKQVLRGIEAAAKTFPIEADPRMVGLISAHGTAKGVLTVATKSLRLLEKAIKGFPIDADVRVAGLITAKTTAEQALKVPQETLRLLEKTIKNFPIDADVRIAGLFTAKETANAALELAKLSLEGLKETVGAAAEVGTFIAEAGLGGLLDVKEAGFEGSLSATNGGAVSLSATIVFMGNESTHTLSFNFHNPIMAVKALVEDLLK